MLRLCFCDALYNSRFSKGALETGALTLIEWITCWGNYKHGAGIYIRHPVEKCTALMALSERWSNKISSVYTTYFIKVSALLHSDSLKAISSISKRAPKTFYFVDTDFCLTPVWWKFLPSDLIFTQIGERRCRVEAGVQVIVVFGFFLNNKSRSCKHKAS